MDIDIEQLRTGDRTAWNQAFEVLYAISLSVCCSSAPDLNHQELEDVAIEAITQVMDYVKNANSFQDCKRLVVTISKNRLLDRFRQRASLKHGGGKLESLDQLEGFDAPDHNQEPPDAAVRKAEQALILAEALNQLPKQYRDVIEDLYLKGLTQQETADRNGLKIGSIGVYRERGLSALAKHIPRDFY